MSDTPRTDAILQVAGMLKTITVEQIKELERENYLLKVNLGVHSCQLEECKTALEKAERENAELLAKVKASNGWDDYSAIKELQRENAALRERIEILGKANDLLTMEIIPLYEEKSRLDWLDSKGRNIKNVNMDGVWREWSHRDYINTKASLRESIDAARKEAHP